MTIESLLLQMRGSRRKKKSKSQATVQSSSTSKNMLAAIPKRCEKLSERDLKKKLFDDFDEENDHVDCLTDNDDDDNTTAPNGSERSSPPTSPNTSTRGVVAGSGIGLLVKQRSVRWSTIEFHNHEVVLGDHPGVDDGPPLSIGWKSVGRDETSIDTYENERPERRRNSELIVPPEIRQRWLIESGYTRSEIKDCLLELAYIQESRRKNAMMNTPWEKVKRRLAATCRAARPTIIEVRAFEE
jgi:hypothetical protein